MFKINIKIFLVVDSNEDGERHFTKDDLKNLFKLENNVISDTHSM